MINESQYPIKINSDTEGFLRIWQALDQVGGGVIPNIFRFRIYSQSPKTVYRLKGGEEDNAIIQAENEDDAIGRIEAAIKAGGLHPSPTKFE